MQKIKNLLVVLSLICFSWITFYVFKGIQSFTPEQLENHLPQDTYFALKINNKRLLGPVISDVIFKQKLRRKDLIKLDKSEKGDFDDVIQHLFPKNELLFFQEKWNQKLVTAVLFKPENPQLLKEKIENFPYYISFHKGLACLVINDTNDVAFTNELRQHIDNLLVQDIVKSPARNKFIQAKNEEDQIQVYISGDIESNVQESISSINLIDNKIELLGAGTKNPVKVKQHQQFHYITDDTSLVNAVTGELPDTLNHYFNGSLKMLGIPTEGIVSTQMHYKGVKLKTEHTQLKLLPQFNGVFHFKDSLKIEDFNTAGISLSEDGTMEFPPLKILGEYFYVLHLNAHEIYVGINENPSFTTLNKPKEFELKGDIKDLLTVDTDPFMLGILNNFPLYRNSRTLLERVEHFEVCAHEVGNNQLTIEGEMRFKDKQEASLELVKYLLSFIR
ncbi:hypothetical protein [Lishizhenia sp.]|uniref:hypothetical protein n=1 Tax=Lishizhenia sp. TaxID=2497594 RepID=UPI00299CF52F|nr:hypothetical protein [Lishizhenia sp.]MDX1445536.1 hypothetical protein [Lishizhenia sp.]